MKALVEFVGSGLIDPEHMPHVIAVQSENCAPFEKVFLSGLKKPEPVEVRPTLAEGIAIGVPMRGDEILRYVYRYGVEIITAPEDRILEARAALAAKGVYCEHTTVATYASYLKYCEKHGRTPDSLLPMCGAGLKSDH